MSRPPPIPTLFPTPPLSRPPAKPAAAPAAPAAAPAAGSGPPLKVGLLQPYSGVYALLGENTTTAAQMYFESVGNSAGGRDRKSTRLNSSHANISYAVFCLKK